MTSPPQPEHLNNRHRDTLRQIFRHPVSHNVEWRAVLSLLEAVGTVTVRHDGKVAVTIGPDREFLDPPDVWVCTSGTSSQPARDCRSICSGAA